MTQRNELATQNPANQGLHFNLHTIEDAMNYAKLIADSDLAPRDYKGKPGNVLIAIQMGLEIGLKPMQAIQNIAVINGRPCIWGDAVMAVIKAHPHYEWCIEKVEGEGLARHAICTIKRRGEEPHTVSFSVEDAKKANLWGKPGPWTQYPDRMLQMRARGFCARDTFTDALKGISVAEEYIDIEARPTQAPATERLTTLISNKSESAKELKEIKNEIKTIDKPSAEKPALDYAAIEKDFLTAKTLDDLKLKFDFYKKFALTPDEVAQVIKLKDKVKATLSDNSEWVKEFSQEIDSA